MAKSALLHPSLAGLATPLAALASLVAPLPALAGVPLPPGFQGPWVTSTEACMTDQPGAMAWTVKGDAIIGAEGAATLSQIRKTGNGGRELIGRFTLEGGGGSWSEELRLTLAQDGLSMTLAAYRPDGQTGETSMPEAFFRCAGPVPRPYQGHWGQSAAECGNAYATRELTKGGFRMPEVGEWATRIAPAPGRGGGLVMDYRLSIADMSYAGRRIVRLSPDGRRLTIDDLGQVETASADPDWRPDPRKRLLNPGQPPLGQEVLVRCGRRP